MQIRGWNLLSTFLKQCENVHWMLTAAGYRHVEGCPSTERHFHKSIHSFIRSWCWCVPFSGYEQWQTIPVHKGLKQINKSSESIKNLFCLTDAINWQIGTNFLLIWFVGWLALFANKRKLVYFVIIQRYDSWHQSQFENVMSHMNVWSILIDNPLN